LGRAADGSMRDALSLTDQAIAFGSGQILEDDVGSMLGSIDLSFVYKIMEAVAGGDPAEVLAIVQAMSEHAPDFEGSLVEIISMIHRLAVAQVAPDAVDNSWGDAERIRTISATLTAEDTQLYYQVAINGKRDIVFASDPRSGFEMILLRMIAFRPAAVLDESLAPEDVQCVAGTQSIDVALEGDPGVKKSLEAQPAIEPAPALPTPAIATDHVKSQSSQDGVFLLADLNPQSWPVLLEQLGLHGIVYNIASHCELRSCTDGVLDFVLDENNATLYTDKHRSRISAVMENYFKIKLSVTVECAAPMGETPAMRTMRFTADRQREAEYAIENDPQLKQLIERFDGELIRSSIAPLPPATVKH